MIVFDQAKIDRYGLNQVVNFGYTILTAAHYYFW